ncbi:hypothetical protein CHCC14821_0825 [Bacillus paralicheniformis]|nr:hypothetical protein CHCC14821_0825 [Bacillus paralicheniformis]TWM60982.1 hypothetical protein CHCC14814_0525 [Bacillus paralicheniformis]
MEKKILITGGTGTTGSRIAKRLVRSGGRRPDRKPENACNGRNGTCVF